MRLNDLQFFVHFFLAIPKYLYEELSVKENYNFLVTVKTDDYFVTTIRIIHKESKDFLEFTYKL
ncbi:MAG TPA: hypothetical protein PKE38_17940 [Ignavibacteriaceae bacterium]|nr:hypothetical protein [Ignavibacteriaceae bacterium]